MCDWLNKFYMAFHDIAVDKLERHGLSNTAHHARQAKMSKLMSYILAIERGCINYLVVATR